MDRSFSKIICHGVGSMPGSRHVQADLPNQDAYCVFKSQYSLAVSIADGLGSKTLSQDGARWAAYLAVEYATNYLMTQPPDASESNLSQLKYSLLQAWRYRFGDRYPDFDSTLAFAAITPTRYLRGQLGDGIILTLSAHDTTPQVFQENNKEFQNITFSLSHRNALDHFKLEETALSVEDDLTTLVLATDGVSDDIENPAAFSTSLMHLLLASEHEHWNYTIESLLKNWPVPSSQDDKTLAVVTLNNPTGHNTRTVDRSLPENGKTIVGVKKKRTNIFSTKLLKRKGNVE